MSQQFRSLSRKESISPKKRSSGTHGNWLDVNKNFSIGCDMASTNTSPTQSSSSHFSTKKVVYFAPTSEILYVPIPSRDEMTKEEINETWFTSKDYEVQRIANQETIALMEQEIKRQTEGDVTVAALSSVVQSIEGARGLEPRTKVMTQNIFRNRQQSIQAVLKEQELAKQKNYSPIDQQVACDVDSAIASAYSIETMISVLDAVERAVHDAKEADILISDPTIFEIISPKSRNKRSMSSTGLRDQRFASEPSNVLRKACTAPKQSEIQLTYNYESINDSLHTLSSPTKRGYKPRPLPQRLSSSSLPSMTRNPSTARPVMSNRNASFRIITTTTKPSLPPLQSRENHPSLIGGHSVSKIHTLSGLTSLSMVHSTMAPTVRQLNHRIVTKKESSSLLSLSRCSKSSHSVTTAIMVTPVRHNSNESKRSNNTSKSHSSRQIVV
jgi:hypothetical protein